MQVFNALVSRELKSWLFSSVLYAYCALFSFFSLFSMFILSGFIAANEAELAQSLLRWSPWVFAMAAPVIGVRSWSEEHHCGMFEVLGSQPINSTQWVLAKAVGAFAVILVGLASTFPALLVVFLLGKPDAGVIASGYFGSLLCGFCFALISQAVCTFMRGSIGAYACSVALCLVLIMTGINQIASSILLSFPNLEFLVDVLAALSITPKYEVFLEGKVALSALLGFVLVALLAITLSVRALSLHRGKLHNGSFFRYGLPLWASLLVYFTLAPVISLIPGHWDVTEDKRFSLPAPLIAELADLERQVTVRLFATNGHTQFNFDLARYQRRIRDLMTEVSKASKGKVVFEQLDPNRDGQAARIAALDEVKSLSHGQSDAFMFGLVVESAKQKRVFEMIDPKRERFFLTDLLQSVLDVGKAERKTLALLSPFSQSPKDGLAAQQWLGLTALSNSYSLEYAEPSSAWASADIVIVHHVNSPSTEFSEQLAQYVDEGGNVIILVDPVLMMAFSFGTGDKQTLMQSTLPAFIRARGVEFSPNLQVYDFALATEHTTEQGTQTNPGILTLGPRQFNPNHAITAGFDYAHFFDSGAFSLSYNAIYDHEVLIESSTQALLIDEKEKREKSIERLQGDLIARAEGYPLMVLIRDRTNRKSGQVLVVADADWLYGAAVGNVNSGGGITPINGNAALMRSMVDYLSGNQTLREFRLQGFTKRPLNQWQTIEQNLMMDYRQPIAELVQTIENHEATIEKLEQVRQLSSGARIIGTQIILAEQRQALRVAEADLSLMRARREARVQFWRNALTWSAVLLVPLIVMFIGIFVTNARELRVRGAMHE